MSSTCSNCGQKLPTIKYKEEINQIIKYLNNKLATNYKANTPKTIAMIKARIDEGFEVEDFKKVIDVKYNDWSLDREMAMYLRPHTLFSTKFEAYLNSYTHKEEEGLVL